MSFALDIRKFAEKAKGNADLVVRHVTISVADSVVMKSPVRTGRFRANWMFSAGAPASGTIEDLDPSGATTIAAMVSAIGSTGAGGVNYISNNLPYGPRLEFEGWSMQAPNGMVRITVAEFQDYVKDALSKLD